MRLISAVTGVGTSEHLPLGLEFALADGWKIYWRSPGDAGYPPTIDWSDSVNVHSAAISWPAPERFSILGFETVGYGHEVVLPLTVTLEHPSEPVAIKAMVDFLTCKDICVPYQVELGLDIGTDAPEPSAYAPRIAEFARRVPEAASDTFNRDGLTIRSIQLTDPAQLVINAQSSTPFLKPDVFVEGPVGFTFSAPQVRLSEGARKASITVDVFANNGDETPSLLDGPVTVTLVDGSRSVETSSILVLENTSHAFRSDTSLIVILGIAVLGGLILNLMPCVLPVLSIKLLSVVGHGGGDRRQVRASFIASAAGIIASFLLLAASMIALKESGSWIGWGLQFQDPLFLTIMALIVTLFACNLWGWFEIPLPAAIAVMDSRASTVRGHGGHFLTGMLATVLATPCSAPFLGTAIGFAFARGPLEIMLVFTALGIGLALPYLLVAGFPSIATRLPRPGSWMVNLRRVLGVILAGTATWLLSILSAHLGSTAAIIVGVLLGLAIAFLALRTLVGRQLSRLLTVATLALAAVVLILPFYPPTTAHSLSPVNAAWLPFDEAVLARHVAEGKTVLVNVTADWCLTCKVNETVIFGDTRVRDRLKDSNILVMQGDWTKPNDAIARYLARFGRYGIPFDAVYGPGRPKGEALPEVLTPDLVLSALDRAQASGDNLSTTSNRVTGG